LLSVAIRATLYILHFIDVAIGAPYEADGKGAVYIYIGSSRRLILSQKLNPEALNLGIRGFGYSLSGAVDIDENGYPGTVSMK